MTTKTKTEGSRIFTKVPRRPNLFLRDGNYYVRFSLKGRQTTHKLDVSASAAMTEVDLILGKKMQEIRQQRVNSPGAVIAETLGQLTAEVRGKIQGAPLAERTKTNYDDHLVLVRKYWPTGTFDTFTPRKVTREMMFALRDRLKRADYSNAYTNAVLGRLGRVLGLARPPARQRLAHDGLSVAHHGPTRTDPRHPEDPHHPAVGGAAGEGVMSCLATRYGGNLGYYPLATR